MGRLPRDRRLPRRLPSHARPPQSVVAKLTSLCFDKCITRPSNSLSRGETNCVNNCAQRYMEARCVAAASCAELAPTT